LFCFDTLTVTFSCLVACCRCGVPISIVTSVSVLPWFERARGDGWR
jgi:hypothetical protein